MRRRRSIGLVFLSFMSVWKKGVASHAEGRWIEATVEVGMDRCEAGHRITRNGGMSCPARSRLAATRTRTGTRSVATIAVAAWFAIGGTAGSAASAATTVVCPAVVHLQSGRIAAADVPASFKSTVESTPLLLSGVSVYDGPPEQGAALAPTSGSRNGDRSTWAFAGPYPDGKWLSCDYADGLVHVSTRADDRSASCDASTVKSGAPRILHGAFTCR